MVAAAVYSLNIYLRKSEGDSLRDRDIALLENIVRRAHEYEFLRTAEDNFSLAHGAMDALASNLRREPSRLEPLILELFGQYPRWTKMFLSEIELAMVRDWLAAKDLSETGLEFLEGILIEMPDLDWDTQNLILLLGRSRQDLILDVFWRRIEHDAEVKQADQDSERRNYRAIPFDINDELTKAISEDPLFQEKVAPWLDRLTDKLSTYNWNIGHFLQQMGSSFNSILKALVQKGDETSLARAAAIIDSFDGQADIELCMEIVGRTDDSRTRSRIDAALYATGVVSGEDGLARAHEAKAALLEPYLKSNNPKIREYAEQTIASLMKSAQTERRRVEEEARLRQIEFER